MTSKKYKFNCTLCTRTFTGKYGLEYHMSSYHNDLRPAVCPICPDKAYRAFGDLNKHIRNLHPELLVQKETLSANISNTEENGQGGNDYEENLSRNENIVKSPTERSKRVAPPPPTHPKVQEQGEDGKNLKSNATKRNSGKSCPWCPRKFATMMASRIHVAMMHRDKRDEFDKLYPPSERTLQKRKESNNSNSSSSETTPEKRKRSSNANSTNESFSNYSSLESSPREKEKDFAVPKSFAQNSKPVKLKPWTTFFTYNVSSTTTTSPSSSSHKNETDHMKNNNNTEPFLEEHMDLEEINRTEIPCNYCEDVFYEQKYLDLHIKHWHKSKFVPNKKSLAPEKSQSRQTNEKKHSDSKRPKDRPKLENSTSHATSKKEKVITKTEKTNLVESLDYSCPSCGRLFSSLGKLEMHAAMHLRNKIFDCSICRSSFQNRKELILHRLSIHQV